MREPRPGVTAQTERAREVLGVKTLRVLQVESVKRDIGTGLPLAARTLGRIRCVTKESMLKAPEDRADLLGAMVGSNAVNGREGDEYLVHYLGASIEPVYICRREERVGTLAAEDWPRATPYKAVA